MPIASNSQLSSGISYTMWLSLFAHQRTNDHTLYSLHVCTAKEDRDAGGMESRPAQPWDALRGALTDAGIESRVVAELKTWLDKDPLMPCKSKSQRNKSIAWGFRPREHSSPFIAIAPLLPVTERYLVPLFRKSGERMGTSISCPPLFYFAIDSMLWMAYTLAAPQG